MLKQINLFEMLEEAKNRPSMFWGNKRTLSDVSNFISGFKAGRIGTNLGIDEKTKKFDGFSAFVSNEISGEATSHSWVGIINSQTSSCDEAFELFYKLLDEFFQSI